MAPDLSDQERALLSRCPLFLGVEDALLRSLPALPGVTVEPFAAGEVLYGPGQFRQSLGVILSGQVQVTNGSLSVSLLRAGELFGAATLYNDAPEFAAVLTAQSPCRVLFLPQETLDRLLGEEPLLRRNYLQYLTGRIRFLSGRLRSVAQTGAEGKLARYLLTVPSGEPLRLSATLGGAEDPAAAAELYGGLHALVWTGMPALEKLVVIRDPGIHLGIDFDAQETRAEGELGISIRLGTLIAVGTQLAVPAIGWLRRFMKRRRMPPASKAADNKAAEYPAA